MGATGVSKLEVCQNCGAQMVAEDSYSGFCFKCLFAPALESDDQAAKGDNGRFDHYEIVTDSDGAFIELGRGAMGVTYKALDVKLRFAVALKVINPTVAGEPVNRERFQREARAAARLRHPHVASVLYYGVRSNQQCFYTMEFVEGETLAARVRRSGPLPVPEALEVASQTAQALAAAEQHGLVHRDLKPANLMLVKGAGINVKVIDFGLAKIVGGQETGDTITFDGFVGTPAFASPEQFAGKEVDQRSDYFSLGSTLFYLLTGENPFKANELTELRQRIVNKADAMNRLKARAIPRPIRDLVSSLVSANPAERPQTAQALNGAISRCKQAIAVSRDHSSGRKRLALLLIGTTVLLLAATSIYFFGSPKESSAKSIAVLPFDDLGSGSDQAYFADGVQDDILTNLAKIVDLQVISRSSVQPYRNPANRPLPPEIGQALHVRYLVNGSVRRAGDKIRVTAQLIEAATGRELWADRYDGDLANVFEIQTRIAEEISQGLRARLSPKEKASIAEAPTNDLAAYELYLHAKELLENYDELTQQWEPLYTAVRLLDEATARDPNFVLAWCRLAEAHDILYLNNGDISASQRVAAQAAVDNAIRLRPDLGEVRLALATHLAATTHDYPSARRELEIALQTMPNSADVFRRLAAVDTKQGRWKDALQHYEKAVALDPKNQELILERNGIYMFHRRYDDFRRLTDEAGRGGAIAGAMDYPKATAMWWEKGDTSGLHALLDEPAGPLRAIGRATLIRIDLALWDHDFAAAKKFLAADPRPEFEWDGKRTVSREYILGWIERSAGNEAAAREAFAKARISQQAYVDRSPDNPHVLMMAAITDAALGRKEDALREGKQAVAMLPISQDALAGARLAADLAQVYVLVGEPELALKQLESLQYVPRALTYGDLAKSSTWDALRSEPRFKNLLAGLGPLPIENRQGQ